MIESLLLLAGFVICLVTLVMFTGAETAIGYISRDSLVRLSENNVRGASLLLGILKNKRRFQLMLISGRIASIVGGTLLLFWLLMQYGLKSGIGVRNTALITLLLSMVVFISLESLLARIAGLGEFEKIVSRFAYFLIAFHIFLFPLTFILEKISSLFITRNVELAAKEEALIEFVKSESEAGVIEREEKDMIESVLEFSDTTVREVMIPRIDMVAAKREIPIDDLIQLFEMEGHSRIPIYEERMDNIIGVIYAKDLLTALAKNGKENCTIDSIMRNAYFVPEKKLIPELLKEFKKNKVHIAIVIDEYGGTAGIVALEDILEEIVGDIQDEYDEDEQDSLWLTNSTVVIDAGLDIDDVNEMIHSSIPDEDFDTLGGFLYHQLGFIPKGGEIVEWEDILFEIKDIQGNRISKVLVKLKEPLNSQEEPET